MQRPDYLHHPSGVKYGKGGGRQREKQPPPGGSALTDLPFGLHIKDIVIHILPGIRRRRLDGKGDRLNLRHRHPPLRENSALISSYAAGQGRCTAAQKADRLRVPQRGATMQSKRTERKFKFCVDKVSCIWYYQ